MRNDARSRKALWVAAVLVIAIVAAGAIVMQIRSSAKRDPRAYPADSGEITLEEGLRRSGIVLPDCMHKDLRYALVGDGFGYHYKVYLYLQASEDCMNHFLVNNAMVDLFQNVQLGGVRAEKALGHRERWMDSSLIREIGWRLGSEQRFQEFQGNTENMYAIDALIQHVPGSSVPRAYVYAFRGG